MKTARPKISWKVDGIVFTETNDMAKHFGFHRGTICKQLKTGFILTKDGRKLHIKKIMTVEN